MMDQQAQAALPVEALVSGAELLSKVAASIGASDLSLHALEILLRVAAADENGEPLDSAHLATIMNLPPSTVSRNIASLGKFHRGRPGMRLLEANPLPTNRRRKPIRLTRKGRMVLALIGEQLVQAGLRRQHDAPAPPAL